MYWQKRFDVPSSDTDLEAKISTIRKKTIRTMAIAVSGGSSAKTVYW